VLRLKTGDHITITDGKGLLADAVINHLSPVACTALIQTVKKDDYTRKYQLHLAVAPTKNIDRYEWFLEKATEIGIDKITPVLCARSERKVINEARLNKLIISASKQSFKSRFPLLMPLIKFDQLINTLPEKEKLIAHCNDNLPLLKNIYSQKNSVIFIGPEGDFTPVEINAAVSAGFIAVSLGQYRLRTETAAIVACNTIAVLNQ
jgi:16S rRNA (uracil1498-N3)-methyltransferase